MRINLTQMSFGDLEFQCPECGSLSACISAVNDGLSVKCIWYGRLKTGLKELDKTAERTEHINQFAMVRARNTIRKLFRDYRRKE